MEKICFPTTNYTERVHKEHKSKKIEDFNQNLQVYIFKL